MNGRFRATDPWRPGKHSAAERLAEALAEDIHAGALTAGDRLPAHRDLAWRLQVGIGTVTKAYAALEARGLVRGVHGRGMFVALSEAKTGPVIDLSRNVPPGVMTGRIMSKTLSGLARRVDAGFFNDYPPVGGHLEHRELLSRWFGQMGVDADPARVLITNGAHHALQVALTAFRPDQPVFSDAQTYPGMIALARQMNRNLTGISMDAEGMTPDGLDAALSNAPEAIVYVTPTTQNPTTATMSLGRRQDIAEVCRKWGAWIIEDDVYSLDASLPPLAALAPERTIYINSLSKTLNASLRTGGLVVPAGRYEITRSNLRDSSVTVSPLGCAILDQWLCDGTVDVILKGIREEARWRVAAATRLLSGHVTPPVSIAYQAWLPLAGDEARRVHGAAQKMGIRLTDPSRTSIAPEAVEGLRLCLGSVTRLELETALSALRGLIETEKTKPGTPA